MELLRDPLYSILAVIFIGALCGAAADVSSKSPRKPRPFVALLAGMGAAFLGFHFAMLSNLATDVIIMPFAVALFGALIASLLMRKVT